MIFFVDPTPVHHQPIDSSLKFEKSISAIKDRLQNRVNPTVDPNSPNNNLLNTIMEESQQPITSTPMVTVKFSDENSFENSKKRRRSSQKFSPTVAMVNICSNLYLQTLFNCLSFMKLLSKFMTAIFFIIT